MPENEIPQPQVVTHRPFRWKKIILTVLVISIVTSIIAVGLYWYLSQNDGKLNLPSTTKQASKSASKSASSSSSILYKNSNVGFTVSYPKGWAVFEKQDKEKMLWTITFSKKASKDDFEVYIYKYYGGSLLSEIRENHKSTEKLKIGETTEGNPFGDITRLKDVSVDNTKALQIETESSKKQVFIDKATIYFVIAENKTDLSEEEFNLFISSFKIL